MTLVIALARVGEALRMSLVYRGFLSASLAAAALGAMTSASAAGGFGGLGDTWQVGGFVFVTPKYEGSKDYEVRGAPFIAPAGLSDDTSWIQFRGPDDLRFRVIQVNGFEAGPLVGWRFDRDDSDASRLRGLGDVDGGIVLGGYVAYDTGFIKPFISYHHGVTGDDTGALVRFGAETKTRIGSASVTAYAGATWADDDFMDAYFSISNAQSLSSRANLAAYNADSGVKDIYIGLNADVPLTDVWTLKLSGKYSHLLDEAADSPIVEDENQFFGGLGLSYKFNFSR